MSKSTLSESTLTAACAYKNPHGQASCNTPFASSPHQHSADACACQQQNTKQHNHVCCCGHTAPLGAQADSPLAKPSAQCVLYRIVNMDCPMEETLIRKKLEPMAGITKLEFNLMQRVLTVHHSLPNTKGIAAALHAIDMDGEEMHTAKAAAAPLPAQGNAWRSLGLALILAAASEVLELLHEWQVAPFGGADSSAFMAWLPLLFALAAIACAGLTTYKKGWISLRTGNLNINALMSIAVTGAVLIGQYPEAAMVMVLFNVAEAIEGKCLDHARNAIQKLLSLTPEQATVLMLDGAWQVLPCKDIALGSHVRVRPGERVALDGLVVQGQPAINQAPITGESLPIEKHVGDVVYAGSINESSSFEFTVTARAEDTTLARIIHAVEEAQRSRAPIQRIIDNFALYYTPAVCLLALALAIFPPLFMGSAWTESIYMALVTLVIGCPCALVISTPVTIISGIAAATKQGIMIKGGAFLEQGRLLNWVALDKTGTLTHGKPVLTQSQPWGTMDATATLHYASSLAALSDHPVSLALAKAGAEQGLSPLDVSDFSALAGLGVQGRLQGSLWRLGNKRLLPADMHDKIVLQHIEAWEKQGNSVVVLLQEETVQAVFAVADTVKESSIAAIQELHQLGVQSMMLTGDNEYSAQTIAAQVGVDAFQANLLPAAKLEAVSRLMQQGTVGMAGDGINDAPALAKADIGFAMAAAGTDTAIETADIALMDDDLRKIPRFIRLSRATHAIIVQNIVVALGIKALFFTLTVLGYGTMWMAVFADVGTSLLVVGNGLRAMR
ncbi:MAG: heavy metal translocating P-type ATPase [Desulfovibrionaceae bacterium]|nr:heavy metal translocating P-type ATPase [Desulfovibrionaceae bacterium]